MKLVFNSYISYPMKKVSILLLSGMLLATITLAQEVDRRGFIKDSLNLYISRALTNWRIPGAAVCVVKDDKIIIMRGYGIKELGMNDRVDENTLFMIGGNT